MRKNKLLKMNWEFKQVFEMIETDNIRNNQSKHHINDHDVKEYRENNKTSIIEGVSINDLKKYKVSRFTKNDNKLNHLNYLRRVLNLSIDDLVNSN